MTDEQKREQISSLYRQLDTCGSFRIVCQQCGQKAQLKRKNK